MRSFLVLCFFPAIVFNSIHFGFERIANANRTHVPISLWMCVFLLLQILYPFSSSFSLSVSLFNSRSSILYRSVLIVYYPLHKRISWYYYTHSDDQTHKLTISSWKLFERFKIDGISTLLKPFRIYLFKCMHIYIRYVYGRVCVCLVYAFWCARV